MGTKYAVKHLLKAYNWDYMTRASEIALLPGEIKIHEFDYRVLNEVIYEAIGVTFRSWPCIHTGDGPISYALSGMATRWFLAGTPPLTFGILNTPRTPI